MAGVLADWLLIGIVIALVCATFFTFASWLDDLIEYWRAYRDTGPPR